MATIVPHQNVNDLWADAASQLSDEERQHINFNRPDKLQILVELRADVEASKQKAINKRWKFVRKSGETVVIRDVFEKIVRWVDTFKQIGDIAVQYDPVHASLPWAGIRLVLQKIAVNDTQKLNLVVEGLAEIAELVCRYALTENLYSQTASTANEGFKRAVVKLYARILGYLSNLNQFFKQGTAKRILKSVVLTEEQLDMGLDAIRTAEKELHPWINLVDREDSVRNQKDLMHLLHSMDAPLRRMDDRLGKLDDHLQSKYLCVIVDRKNNWFAAKERNEILRWLSPEPYKQHHIQASQDILSGTGQWLLSDSVFKQWKDESASSIIWLHGIAGSGKSKLVSIVIEDALDSFKAGNSPQPVYFYCSRNPTEPARSDPKAILASIARQLSSTRPGKPLLQPSIDLYNKEEAEGFVSGQPQLGQSLELIMQLTELYPQTTIILDALDECGPATRLGLLRALEDILQHSCSLVKIFVSSRNDQDIVRQLNGYLNLEIDSRKNSNDIAQFVNVEVERLIKDGKLLRNSKFQDDMKRMIIRKVTKDAAEMFRWASMQLQYLCSFKFDIDIENSLGRLPPDLYTLYGDIYDALSKTPGDRGATVFENVLRWLLCAQRRLNTNEFLAVVSVDPSDKTDSDPLAKEDVLEICNNFVVFDEQFETFRFAHLSVREFLEQQLNISEANRLMAEICLWSVLSEGDEVVTTDLLRQLELRAGPVSTLSDMSRPSPSRILYEYAIFYWATHCKLAGDDRESPDSALKPLLRHMLSHTPSFSRWNVQLRSYHTSRSCDRKTRIQLYDAIALPIPGIYGTSMGVDAEFHLYKKVGTPDLFRKSILEICCVFDFREQVELVLEDQVPGRLDPFEYQRILQLAAKYGSPATLQQLLMTKYFTSMEISGEVVEAAAGNSGNAKGLITLLFDHPGGTAAIGESNLCAAARNKACGEAVMPLLLDRLRRDISITAEGIETAASNPNYGVRVVAFLLDQLKADIVITAGIVKAAIGNARYGDDILRLLFDRTGADIPIPLEVVKEAADNERIEKESMLRLLNQLSANISITLEIVKEAAGNEWIHRKVMLRLLDQLGEDAPITLDVVKTAAGNRAISKEIMFRLLDQLGEDAPITLDVVKTAAGNMAISKEVMLRLLDQLGADVPVDVVEKAAITCVEDEVMLLLLDRIEAGAPITAELIATIAKCYDADIIAFLLDQRGTNVQITEDIVKGAAHPDKTVEQRKMAVLLKRLARDDAGITIGLMASIVEHFQEDLIASLLDQRGADIPIAEEVVKAVVHGPREEVRKKMAVLLEHREREILEVLAQLPDEGWMERLEFINTRLARMWYENGWIYWRRNKTGSVSVM